jgi:predicted nucleotidyltransferase
MRPEDKIYKAYFDGQKNKLYFNELKRLTGLSDSSLANALSHLVKKNILIKEKTISNTFYTMRDKKLFVLKFSEIAIQRFNGLRAGVKIPLTHFLKNIPKEVYTVVLFGSASRREERKGSDVDMLIVARNKTDVAHNKKEAEITSAHPLSLFHATVDQFTENKDDIIIQARKTGFPIHKEQNFYEAVLDEY